MASSTPAFFDPAKDCDEHTPREIFARYGYAPTPPGELNNRQVPGRLWELLLCRRGPPVFLCLTDHLNERGFYTLFSEEWRTQPTDDIPPTAETNTRLMVFELNPNGVTPGERPPALLRQRCGERAQPTQDYPEDSIPPNEKPPCDRDWRLPRVLFESARLSSKSLATSRSRDG